MKKSHTTTTLLSLATLLSFSILTVGSIPPETTNGSDFIRTSCNSTLYADLCFTSLSSYASAVQTSPARLARLAIALSLSRARAAASYVAGLSRLRAEPDRRAASALSDCVSNLRDAVDEMRGSMKQMRRLGGGGGAAESFRFGMSNVQTWMSAALTDEETCTDGFDGVAESPVKGEVSERVADVKRFTSNALALVNTYAEKGMP